MQLGFFLFVHAFSILYDVSFACSIQSMYLKLKCISDRLIFKWGGASRQATDQCARITRCADRRDMLRIYDVITVPLTMTSAITWSAYRPFIDGLLIAVGHSVVALLKLPTRPRRVCPRSVIVIISGVILSTI